MNRLMIANVFLVTKGITRTIDVYQKKQVVMMMMIMTTTMMMMMMMTITIKNGYRSFIRSGEPVIVGD